MEVLDYRALSTYLGTVTSHSLLTKLGNTAGDLGD